MWKLNIKRNPKKRSPEDEGCSIRRKKGEALPYIGRIGSRGSRSRGTRGPTGMPSKIPAALGRKAILLPRPQALASSQGRDSRAAREHPRGFALQIRRFINGNTGAGIRTRGTGRAPGRIRHLTEERGQANPNITADQNCEERVDDSPVEPRLGWFQGVEKPTRGDSSRASKAVQTTSLAVLIFSEALKARSGDCSGPPSNFRLCDIVESSMCHKLFRGLQRGKNLEYMTANVTHHRVVHLRGSWSGTMKKFLNMSILTTNRIRKKISKDEGNFERNNRETSSSEVTLESDRRVKVDPLSEAPAVMRIPCTGQVTEE
ncbi:hypothetical protein GE061_012720 [Apolygus lucorum]|uniref:Uncharacterized protein n=1 Tax=Apolygus lucorum TaxID=248454 RepID=A0A8S9XUE9_APOLU|nr:hypothetical protein GE061_012720 [Apolygus lucorum]